MHCLAQNDVVLAVVAVVRYYDFHCHSSPLDDYLDVAERVQNSATMHYIDCIKIFPVYQVLLYD
jgi:hypothetical protein